MGYSRCPKCGRPGYLYTSDSTGDPAVSHAWLSPMSSGVTYPVPTSAGTSYPAPTSSSVSGKLAVSVSVDISSHPLLERCWSPEPVVGWRLWGMSRLTGAVVSPVVGEPWDRAPYMMADHKGGGGVSFHSSPQPNCLCGVNAMKRFEDLFPLELWNLGVELLDPTAESPSNMIPLFGRVALFGRVIEFEHGWRASLARMLDVWPMFDSEQEANQRASWLDVSSGGLVSGSVLGHVGYLLDRLGVVMREPLFMYRDFAKRATRVKAGRAGDVDGFSCEPPLWLLEREQDLVEGLLRAANTPDVDSGPSGS